MHAAQKILADFQVDDTIDKNWFLELLDGRWASSISQLFEGVDSEKGVAIPNELREEMEPLNRLEHGTRLRIEKEVEDAGFQAPAFTVFYNDTSTINFFNDQL